MSLKKYNGFSEFGIPAPILNNLSSAGFLEPKPIQKEAIPVQLAGNDLLAIAQTGSGKTAAFCLPLISNLLGVGKKRFPKTAAALILVPTRELAMQIEAELYRFVKGSHLSIAVVFGGVSRHTQIKKLAAGVDILVATPGRLMDLVSDKAIDLAQTRYLVLDEGDRMLDMGFIGDIKKIIRYLPLPHQTSLFSATMPKEIAKLSSAFLKNPIRVGQEEQGKASHHIEQIFYGASHDQKKHLLATLLDDKSFKSIMIFSRTKYGADGLERILSKYGYDISVIHGNKSQGARQRALQSFRDGKLRILIATDIAARGIDVPSVDLVINYELPDEAENYIHRIGRTGRNGASGVAVTLYDTNNERNKLRSIERLIRTKVMIRKMDAVLLEARAVVKKLPVENKSYRRDEAKKTFSRPKRRFRKGDSKLSSYRAAG